MRIERHYSRWSDACHFGPYLEWQEWSLHHHEFIIGFSFGPFDVGLKVMLWDFFEFAERQIIPALKERGMTEKEAWQVLTDTQRRLIDRLGYKFKLWPEVKKELNL